MDVLLVWDAVALCTEQIMASLKFKLCCAERCFSIFLVFPCKYNFKDITTTNFLTEIKQHLDCSFLPAMTPSCC